ncbi:MAG: shikimate dehydrogenase [Treponema sp.]|jgi:shikimate dehydrogenase|nr:shikimate dehydrogenase [Treponema sp.]
MEAKCYRSEMIGLFGSPVDENATVVIMEAAFKELNLNYRYNTTLVHPKDLETAVKALKAFNMKGTNITVPHKVEVLKYLDHLTETAALMGAVNTIYIKDGETYGENTDGKGFITSIHENNIPIEGQRILVLGAGGAARAMTIELAGAGASVITIVNRNRERGEALVELLNTITKAKAEFVLWDGTYHVPKDTNILVNATSVGMFPSPDKPNIDYSTLLDSMIVCDGVHNPPQTPFLIEAAKRGCKTLDGFSMLVNQGAISFKIWTGHDAPVDVMKNALRKEFNR